MASRVPALALAGVAALLLAGCLDRGSPGTEENPVSGAVFITIRDRDFWPDELWVMAGTTVHWENEDAELHGTRARAWAVDLPAGKVVPVRMTEPGAFAFSCPYHGGMMPLRGTLHVV